MTLTPSETARPQPASLPGVVVFSNAQPPLHLEVNPEF